MTTLTIAAAARLCGCHRRTLQRAIHAGRLQLDAQHRLSREELIAAGYLIVETPQDAPQQTPLRAPQDMPTHFGRPGLAPETLAAIAAARARYPELPMRPSRRCSLTKVSIADALGMDGRSPPITAASGAGCSRPRGRGCWRSCRGLGILRPSDTTTSHEKERSHADFCRQLCL